MCYDQQPNGLRYQWRDYIGECLHIQSLNKRENLKVSTDARTSGARVVGRRGERLVIIPSQYSVCQFVRVSK